MTLTEIYCIGVIAQALYYLVKRLMWSKEKVVKYTREADELERREGIPVRKLAPFIIALMCLLWPYMWFERLFLKR